MHKESGYIVSIVPTKSYSPSVYECWFGLKTNPNGSIWKTTESFMTNGLKPFPDLKSAQEAENELKIKIKFKNSEISHIKLNISENSDDLRVLKDQKNLVVIQTIPEPMKTHEIIGKFKEKVSRQAYIPGSFFNSNGRKPFDNYSDAEYTAQEVRRQAQCHATIATLIIKKMH